MAIVLDVEIGECAVDVRADLLAGLGRAKDPDDGDLGLFGDVERADIVAQLRIIARRRCLVVIDAIQPDPEKVHAGDSGPLNCTRRDDRRRLGILVCAMGAGS